VLPLEVSNGTLLASSLTGDMKRIILRIMLFYNYTPSLSLVRLIFKKNIEIEKEREKVYL